MRIMNVNVYMDGIKIIMGILVAMIKNIVFIVSINFILMILKNVKKKDVQKDIINLIFNAIKMDALQVRTNLQMDLLIVKLSMIIVI